MVAGGMDDLSVFRDKLISLVDLLPDESAKLMDQRPRFAHAVLVLANQDLPGEILKANYIKQLDPYWIQTKGTPLSSPSQPIQLFNQQSLHLQTSNQDTQTAPFQWSSNLEDKMAGPGQKMTSSETSVFAAAAKTSANPHPFYSP
uniref:Uncharacterized protein n=1 Tax=Ditylenchus dipsaci TaxID=166011 RepID=A0A915E4T1_9BILA